jgi:hypothetical protein
MGLDSYLKIRRKLSEKEQMCINLGYPDTRKPKEIAYWRKVWEVIEIFSDILEINIDNCEDYEVNEEQLKEFIVKAEENDIDVSKLKKEMKKINWKTHKVIFHNWW